MKKFSTVLLVAMMSISLVACGKGKAVEEEDTGFFEEVTAEAPSEASKEAATSESAGQDAAKEASVAEKAASQASSKEASTADKSTEKASESTSEASKEASEEKAAEAATEASTEAQEQKQEAEQTPAPAGYGRMVFVGDSRTVDMFSSSAEEINGGSYNDITVFCRDGAQYEDMVNYINGYGVDNFDTLVSWMGCNDFGNFSQYGPYYDSLIAQGKQVVVCTVGPTQDEYLLDDMDWYYYPNANQINYNNSLVSWANGKGVKVIDLYSYISNSSNITLVPTDGIHYLPQPTTELWGVIVGNLK